MTSPVGVIGLAYSGYDLQRADLNVMFAISEGLDTLPAVRGADQLIPFRTGLLAQVRTADHRAVVATGWVAGAAPAPEASYRAYLDGLKAVLDPERLPGLLVATLTDGSVRWISAVPRNILGGEMVGYEMRPMSIEWEALDPYWYSSWAAATLDSGLLLDTGYFLDGGADIIISGSATLTNPGTTDSEKVRVVMTGPSVGPVGIEVASTLVGWSYGATLAAGQTLTVDNDARTVTLVTPFAPTIQGRANLTLHPGNAHGEYLRLAPGPQTIRVVGAPAQTRLHFQPAYL